MGTLPTEPTPDAELWWLSAATIDVERVPPTFTFVACASCPGVIVAAAIMNGTIAPMDIRASTFVLSMFSHYQPHSTTI